MALAAAAVLLSTSLRISLVRGLDNQARQGAQEVAALANANRLPTTAVPVVPGTITVQVLDAQGRIVDVSPDADRLVPLLPPAVAARNARDAAGRVHGRPAVRPADADPGGSRAHQAGGTVIAAISSDQVTASLAT